MEIKVHPEVLKLLGESDIEKVMNDIAMVYATGGFVRTADVVQKFTLEKIFRKRCDLLAPKFDEISHEFTGVALMGRADSQSIWIPSAKFCEALEEHTDVIVLKSPRGKGSSVKLGKKLLIDPEEWRQDNNH